MKKFLHLRFWHSWRILTLQFVLLMMGLSPLSFDSLFAQTVNVDDAKAIAKALRQGKNFGGQSRTTVSDLQLVYTGEMQSVSAYYVFNYSEGGFAIIGADKKAKPVLGYCDDGEFQYNQIPDGLKDMLNAYTEQIIAAKLDPKSDYFAKESVADLTRTSVSPLITTRWNQGEPYNKSIPVATGTTSRFFTGCGATAVAQILKYYNYPTKGIGTKSYTRDYSVNGVTTQVTFMADFENTTYNWAKMLNDYSSGSYTTTQANAVGLLMYHAGVALEMDYGWDGSSSYSNVVIPAFVNYFGYNPNAYLAARSNYSNAEWEALVYSEIAAGRPLWYRGSSSSGGGHAFVCDGYDASQDTYHFNWGWGGYCDGYFPLTGSGALDPYHSSDGNSAFVNDQMATVGLMPVSMLVPVSDITLNVSNVTLTIGSTESLRATISPSDATMKTIVWSSDNERVAIVNNSGVVTAVGVGSANIVCAAADGSGVRKTCAITVTSNLASRGNVITRNTAEAVVEFSTTGSYEWDWDGLNNRLMSTNTSVQNSTSETTLNITTFAATTEFSFDYSVSSESGFDKLYVILDGSYIVSGYSGETSGSCSTTMSPGSHTLILRYQKDGSVDRDDDKAYVSNLQFALPTVRVSNIALNANAASLIVGATKKLKATITPTFATDATVKWTSSNKAVAKVSSSGTVTAMGLGSAIIKCTANDGFGAMDSCVVSVVQPVSTITLNLDSVTLWKGETLKLTKTVAPTTATDKTVSWSSANTKIATVSTSGTVTAKGAGCVVIRCTAKDGFGAIDSCIVTVKQMVSSITLSDESVTILAGKTKTLTASILPSNATEPGVKWSSSDKTIATVSSSGKITAKTTGTCTITCTAADGKGAVATCELTVLQPVTSVTLSSTALTLTAGAYKTLKATVAPSNAADRTVTWTSSKTKVATVSASGKVVAVSPGTTTIKCKANDGSGKYAECIVTVEPFVVTESAPEIAKGSYGPGGISFNKSVSAGKYYPLCLPYGINVQDYSDSFSKIYIPMGMALYQSSGTLIILFKEINSGTISSKQPFVARALNSGTVSLVNNADIKISTLTNPSPKPLEVYDFNAKTGLMSLNTNLSVEIGGTYTALDNLDSQEIMSLSTSAVLSGVTTLKPYRFYIIRQSLMSLDAKYISNIAVSFSVNEETAIEQLMNDAEDEDIIIYDLNGQRIDQETTSGIFIKNGKKFIKK